MSAVLDKAEKELKASKPNGFFLQGYLDQKAGKWMPPPEEQGADKDHYTRGYDLRMKQVIQERRKHR